MIESAPEIVKNQIIYIPLQGMLLQVILMSFLTLEFTISFLKVLNIDFPLILISLNVVERLLLYMTSVIVGANGKMLNLRL